jgi:hypothetical protein
MLDVSTVYASFNKATEGVFLHQAAASRGADNSSQNMRSILRCTNV